MFVLGDFTEVKFLDKLGKVIESVDVETKNIQMMRSSNKVEVNLSTNEADLQRLNHLTTLLKCTKHSKRREKMLREIKIIKGYFNIK